MICKIKIKRNPLGEKSTPRTDFTCPSRERSDLPLRKSQTLTALSTPLFKKQIN